MFTHDHHPGPDWQLIPEKGAYSSAVTHQCASTSWKGLGCVVLMQKNTDRYGPKKSTLVTQESGCDTAPEPADDETIEFFEAHHIEQLTDAQ